jgi:DNA-binding MarR family transcriptional regulator
MSKRTVNKLAAADALDELIEVLPRVVRGLRRFKGELGDVRGVATGDLGPRHGKVVSLLLDGPKTVGQLARGLELTLAGTSNLVADLDHAGVAERHPDPDDRRRTIVSLVPDRRVAIETWLTAATAPMANTLKRLTPKERAAFVSGLQKLAEELGRAGDERPGRPA